MYKLVTFLFVSMISHNVASIPVVCATDGLAIIVYIGIKCWPNETDFLFSRTFDFTLSKIHDVVVYFVQLVG